MPIATCPNPEALAAFARGALTATELSAIAEHVGVCETCCRALEFVPEDSLANLAREAVASPVAINSTKEAPSEKSDLAAKQIPAGFVDHPRYQIISQLGAGGMGTVYKAKDLLMGRIIAIKVVSPHLTTRASVVARFRREICAVAQLKDHRIVTTHDAGEAGGSQFLVMEFVEGVSLDRLVAKKGSLSVQMACAFVRQVALGLQHAADKGMVHRDIKPQNLMVTRKGQVKILDFGLARFARTDEEAEAPPVRLPFGAGKAPVDAGVTNPNLLMGTPDYLSPEQARNSHDVDARSDIYSLGCTLHFLLTGQPPFPGASSLIDKLLAHTNEEPPAIRDSRPDISEDLAEVLAKMMAKNPADRYQTASEVAAAMLPFTRATTTEPEPVFEIVDAVVVNPPLQTATPKSAITLGQVAPLAIDTNPERHKPTLHDSPRPKRRKKKRASWFARRKWALIGGAAVLLLVLVGVVIAANAGKKGNSTTNTNDPPGSAKANDPPIQENEKANRDKSLPGNVAIGPQKNPKVLYVLPSHGVWYGDYEPVREVLDKNHVIVETASTDGGRARFANPPAGSVAIDKLLTATMDLSEYSAVIFAGENVDEYLFKNRGAAAAGTVMKKMQDSNRVVAGICLGEAVLAHHQVLNNKNAAHSRHLFERYPPFIHSYTAGKEPHIKWSPPGKPTVIVDGNIITASGENEAVPFADAILKAIRK